MAKKSGDQYRYVIRGDNQSRRAVVSAQKDLKTLGRSLFEFSGTVDFATNIAGKFARGMGALGRAFAEPIRLAAEQQRVEKQLAAVLESTAGIAGVTEQAAKDLASAYQNLTTFGDEAIIGAQNLLLTFTNISAKGGVFDRAVGVILDVSAAMDQDLKQSSIQLGKALNDPIAGVSALGEVGITFSDSQKEMIKTLAETNRVAEAQSLILDELDRQFGGSAKAARDTFGGAVTSLQNSWGDLLEQLGSFITESPEVRRAIAGITEMLGEMTSGLATGEGEWGSLQQAAESFVSGAVPAVLRASASIIDALEAVASAATNLGDIWDKYLFPMGKHFAELGRKVETFFGDELEKAEVQATSAGDRLRALADEIEAMTSAVEEAASPTDRYSESLENMGQKAEAAHSGFARMNEQLAKLRDLPPEAFAGLDTMPSVPAPSIPALPSVSSGVGTSAGKLAAMEAARVKHAQLHEERMIAEEEYQAMLHFDSQIMLAGLQSVFTSAAAGFESLSEGWRRFTAGAKAQFTQALLDPIFGAQSALNDLLKPVFNVFRSIGQGIHDVLIKPLIDGILKFFGVKVAEEAAAAKTGAGIHAASAKAATGITLGAVAAMMPSLSAAATASLIATFGGAGSAAGLLPGLLATAKAEGAAAVAFAEGGHVTGPTFALVGEDGAETVVPETKPARARKLLGEMFARNPNLAPSVGRGIGGTQVTVNVYVSGDADAEEIAYQSARAFDERLGGLT